MEIIKSKDAEGTETCYIKCEIHNYFYTGRPPLTTGCTSCWMTYFTGQQAQAKEKDEHLDILESMLHGMVEQEDDLARLDLFPKIELTD
jgi:hypothetical protein